MQRLRGPTHLFIDHDGPLVEDFAPLGEPLLGLLRVKGLVSEVIISIYLDAEQLYNQPSLSLSFFLATSVTPTRSMVRINHKVSSKEWE